MSLSASLGLSWGQLAGLSELTLPEQREGWGRVREAHPGGGARASAGLV